LSSRIRKINASISTKIDTEYLSQQRDSMSWMIADVSPAGGKYFGSLMKERTELLMGTGA
jgi:hypothetical protein